MPNYWGYTWGYTAVCRLHLVSCYQTSLKCSDFSGTQCFWINDPVVVPGGWDSGSAITRLVGRQNLDNQGR